MSEDGNWQRLYPGRVYDWTQRGRFGREMTQAAPGGPVRIRYFVFLAGRRIRVPWLVWAMFS